jgi:geranylgeranyl pyrophosphate synthase
MIDDLEDSRYDIVYISTIRRNLPCTHLLFGVDVAVNAGNFMYFAPILKFMSRTTFNNDQKVKFY